MNEALIKRFFDGLCTKEEAEQVLTFLKDNPQHAYLLNEWENADNESELPNGYTQEMYDEVEKRMRPAIKIKRMAVMLAAAACLTAMAIIWWPSKQAIAPQTLANNPSKSVRWIEKVNTTHATQEIMPGDGSKITLMPGASVKYADGFGLTASRIIYMQGEAIFDVHKNRENPFVVYSNYINTTAIGTSFKVTARTGESSIKVRLLEGKVVVKLNDSSLQKTQADYFLQPGQEILFKASNKQPLLYMFNRKAESTLTTAGKHLMPDSVNEVEYMFNNQTLADVLDHLSQLYKVSIQYSKADIGRIYFIGKIEKTDSVEKTIRDIAVLNGLSVTKQNGGFILRKKKH